MKAPRSPGDGPLTATARTTLRRRPGRGHHDRATVNAIVDASFVCHVGVVVDGAPRVLPTAHARIGDRVYVHGARQNRLFCALASGEPACVTMTLLDGLVFARSWFHHSMNYRCAVLYGSGSEVLDAGTKLAALAALVEKAAPGRTREARPPTAGELAATIVVGFPIDEASAKVRSGPPADDPEQLGDDCWAGVLPVALSPRAPEDDPALRPGVGRSRAVGERARLLGPGARAAEAPYERSRGDHVVSTDPGRLDFGFVHGFLAGESYWARGVAEHAAQTAMAHSLCFGLYEGKAQVGFARVLTDFGRIAYLADVFVAPAARGAGLGKWLVACVLEHPDLSSIPKWLLGTADAHGLYARHGFVVAGTGRFMVRG